MKIVENWLETLLKAWSVRFTALWGTLIAYFVAFPDKWHEVQALIPEQWRGPASIAIGFAIFASTAGSRVVAQKNLTKPQDSGDPQGE